MTSLPIDTHTVIVDLASVFLLKLATLIAGFLVVKMGWVLVDKGTTGQFKFKTDFLGFTADLASLSPGLLFVVVGVWLMAWALYVDKSIIQTTTFGVPPPPAVTIPTQ